MAVSVDAQRQVNRELRSAISSIAIVRSDLEHDGKEVEAEKLKEAEKIVREIQDGMVSVE